MTSAMPEKRPAKDDSSSDEGVIDKTPIKKSKGGGNRVKNADGEERLGSAVAAAYIAYGDEFQNLEPLCGDAHHLGPDASVCNPNYPQKKGKKKGDSPALVIEFYYNMESAYGPEYGQNAPTKYNNAAQMIKTLMIEIGSMRYVNVRNFRGKALIDVREYYMDKASGELRPGKKGISLTREQYENFKAIMSEIDSKL
ncbi:transcriptional Coactivator p15 [Ancylostoma ceylanicum]|uniref:Transcriptional Coactivator p15 n=1 Tax=Ancylostoma ceylanicum TaxID=53326 RepID=A0A0D6LAF7_9BILA|nr:transcriptional Coactivator p15 [Ancylostoma ceylanicum]